MAGSPLRILWVDIDSLRPDHLGCHGYPRSTSPNIDALAAEGARFDRLYTSDSPCLPSRSAIQTGLFGIHNGAVGHGGTAADPFSEGLRRGFRSPRAHGSLAAVLSRAGLWTTTISVFGQHHSALHWYAGFNEAIQDGYRTWSAEGVGRHALDWLERNADRDRWFLHVHVWDPHTPYTGTPEDAEALGDGRPDWVTDEVLARHRAQGGPHSASEVLGFGNSPLSRSPSFPLLPDSLESLDDVARAFDGYDTGVRRADALVGRLLDALAAQGVADDTVVVVSSDHGENFGELGVWCDHHTADEYTHRIPGIVRWPGVLDALAGSSSSSLHYHLDLFATLVELAGAVVPAHWDGEGFADVLRDGEVPAGRSELVLSAAAWTVQRSLRWDDRLYVRRGVASRPGRPRCSRPRRADATRTTSSWRRAARSTCGASCRTTWRGSGPQVAPPSPTSWRGAGRTRRRVVVRRRSGTSRRGPRGSSRSCPRTPPRRPATARSRRC